MNILNKIFISNFDIAAFVGAIITFVGSVYLFTISSRKVIERERYDKLVFPLFDLLEPYLFKKKNDEIFQQAIALITENKSIAGGKFLHLLFWCQEHPSQQHFILLCSTVNSEYDRICRILGLSRRSIFYRLDRDQYKTRLMFLIYICINCIILLLCSIALLFVTTFFMTLLGIKAN